MRKSEAQKNNANINKYYEIVNKKTKEAELISTQLIKSFQAKIAALEEKVMKNKERIIEINKSKQNLTKLNEELKEKDSIICNLSQRLKLLKERTIINEDDELISNKQQSLLLKNQELRETMDSNIKEKEILMKDYKSIIYKK